MDNLENRGFIILRNVISPNNIKYAQNSITTKLVNYKNIEIYLKNVQTTIYNYTHINFKITKYRVSNNNNSIDAGHLHKDVRAYNNNKPVPIYTCLSYLDKTIVQLIPYSHKKIKYKISAYNKRLNIQINPGDILIINAALIHRGLFYFKTEHRRLIQMFDCIEKKIYNNVSKKILHTPCINKCNNTINKINRFINNNQNITNILSFLYYYCNISNNYGDNFNYLKNTKYKNFKYISTEADNIRFYPKYNGYEKINCYILLENTNDILQKDLNMSRYYDLYLNVIVHIIYLILIITLFIILIYYIYNKLLKYF